jgi:hypothetical protein
MHAKFWWLMVVLPFIALDLPCKPLVSIAEIAVEPPQSPPQSKATMGAAQSEQCIQTRFSGYLEGGQPYSRDLGGGLAFRLNPLQQFRTKHKEGWLIQVMPNESSNQDYAYPLNPLLRQANPQWVATAYDFTVRQQLSHEHDVRFILDPAEYKRIDKLTTDALWPYYAPNPDKAAEIYLNAIEQARSGLIRFVPMSFDTSTDGSSVHWMNFNIFVTVPSDFQLAPDLNAVSTECPPQLNVHANSPATSK